MLAALLSNSRLFLLLTVTSLILLLTDNWGVLQFPKSVLQRVTIPIQYGLYKTNISLAKQFEFIILARRSAQEQKALREQLAQVLSENANLRKKLAEQESLLKQSQALNPETFQLLAARPIGISRFLLIDRGSEDGLKIGQAVVYRDNFLGEIKEVSAKKAQVRLTSDPDSRISAFVANPNGRARGVLSGQFGSEMSLEKILHQEPVSVNDLVYSEGSELAIPRGLILGMVTQVIDRDDQLFKTALVKPMFEVTSLDVVFVITE